MKKVLLKITSLILMFSCVMGIVACEKFTLNFLEVKYVLIDRDYKVEIKDDFDFAVEEELYAVNNANEWINITCFKEESVAQKYFEMRKLEMESGVAYYRARVECLKEFLKYDEDKMMSNEINEIKDEIKELEAKIKEIDESVKNEIGINGNYVWYGTKYAILDSKILE